MDVEPEEEVPEEAVPEEEVPAEEVPDEDESDPDEDEAADGVCDGDCRLLLVESVDRVTELALDALWPGKDLAAATEITPVAATAPASIQRLIRRIRASP